jgi:hypothetical protein
MRSTLAGSCAVFAMVLASAGCGAGGQPAAVRAGVTNRQAPAPATKDEGWATLVEADRRMAELSHARDGTTDTFRLEVIDRHLRALRARSDRLVDDMAVGDGRGHDAAIRADVAGLDVALGRASADMQREAIIP